ncbi:hypothetical protein Barb7_02870 [Bacteroidales bacterium Barb7]|nr:hypothetical protein Barb7_02870 [Bacteroidales bacterium Barb7]
MPDVIDDTPRTRTTGACPTAPEGVMMLTPAALPCKADSALGLGTSLNDSPLMEATEAVTVRLFCVP